MGEKDHSTLQGAIFAWFYYCRRELGAIPFVEQRVQVSPSRFRVPDVCVTLGVPAEQIFTEAPFICIEILSPEDRLSAMQERVTDYLNMGVRYVWILDPKTRNLYRWTADGMHQIHELRTEDPAIHVPIEALFEE